MRIAVQDANILIDLEQSGLLGAWLGSGYETHTTSLVAEEIAKCGFYQEVEANFHSGRIIIHDCSAERMEECLNEKAANPGISLSDASVYLLAQELDAMLLTGDLPLRKLSKANHVETHGTLWIFDQLISLKKVTPASAAAKLEQLLTQDRYLPREECQKRIRKWRIEA